MVMRGGAPTEGRPYNCYWLSIAPISVPLGVPALIKSLPEASLRKLPRLMLPLALRVTVGVRLRKSAALTTSPFPLTLHAVDPPAIGIRDVDAYAIVAVCAGEGQIVCEDM